MKTKHCQNSLSCQLHEKGRIWVEKWKNKGENESSNLQVLAKCDTFKRQVVSKPGDQIQVISGNPESKIPTWSFQFLIWFRWFRSNQPSCPDVSGSTTNLTKLQGLMLLAEISFSRTSNRTLNIKAYFGLFKIAFCLTSSCANAIFLRTNHLPLYSSFKTLFFLERFMRNMFSLFFWLFWEVSNFCGFLVLKIRAQGGQCKVVFRLLCCENLLDVQHQEMKKRVISCLEWKLKWGHLTCLITSAKHRNRAAFTSFALLSTKLFPGGWTMNVMRARAQNKSK